MTKKAWESLLLCVLGKAPWQTRSGLSPTKRQKADKKLRALEKDELDAALGVVYSDSSATEAEGSWKRSTKGKKAKKGTPAQGVSGSLEKDKAESLEKDKAGPSQDLGRMAPGRCSWHQVTLRASVARWASCLWKRTRRSPWKRTQ